MDIEVVIAISLIVLMISLVIFFGIIDYKTQVVKHEMDNKRAEDWLAAENLKPRTKVMFVLDNGETKFTAPFEPYCHYPSRYGIRYTSHERAERYIAQAYESGFFKDESGVTYPTCKISSAFIHVSNGGV